MQALEPTTRGKEEEKRVRRVYMDYAATTPVAPEVLEEMLPYFSERFGNASSIHSFGREARRALEDAREKIARGINADASEVFFTSGGTESDNLAIKGVALASKRRGKRHIITSRIEHHAVLGPCESLEALGFDVTYLPVDEYGRVRPEDLEAAIREDTCLVSIMHANNEIGTIEPIAELAAIAAEHGVLFHTDAVQSVGKIEVDVRKLGVDLLSISSHKIYGPKGIGALYVRKDALENIEPIIHGGGHERGLRSGTENVAAAVGFGKAVELAVSELDAERERLTRLRDTLIRGVLEIEDTRLNGHPTERLPNNANFCFARIDGEALVLRLDALGIAASTASACSSHDPERREISHVILAIGVPPELARGSLRLTLGRYTTEDDVKYVLEVLPDVVTDLRRISAL
ncbi:MAG: cysteine desulfurase NifS [Candidatus Alkanophagales archaeon]